MSDFWEFITAVFWHWQSWIGGSGAGGAVVVCVAIYERLSGHVMGKRMYASIFIIVFLLGAFFVAWRDQYHARIAAEQRLNELTMPNLQGYIADPVAFAPAGDKKENTLTTLVATIKNTGAPTSVQIGRIYLQTVSGETLEGELVPPPQRELILSDDNGKTILRFQYADYLPRKVSEQPIPTNGTPQGFMIVLFHAPRERVAQKGNQVCFDFYDINGKQLTACKNLSGKDKPPVRLEDIQPK
jgi:hypothetical protein